MEPINKTKKHLSEQLDVVEKQLQRILNDYRTQIGNGTLDENDEKIYERKEAIAKELISIIKKELSE